MFSNAFRPALNKQGYSKLTFVGIEVKEGKRKDSKEPWSMFLIKFDCMGKYYGSSQEVSVNTGFSYDLDNSLGKVLSCMGFEPPKIKTVVDPDGFEIESPESLDDDDFAREKAPELDVEGFLESKVGQIFLGKVVKNDRGFWVVDPSSLKPIKKSQS